MPTFDLDETRAWSGLEVFDHTGDRVGRLSAIYADTADHEPRFGLVRTGLFGLRSVLVPLEGAFEEGGALILDLERHLIKGAPHLRREEPLAPEAEAELYSHYGMEVPTTSSGQPRLELMQLEHAD
ncbi:MAG TPA: PRC-barrel domain-containing protein [Thermoleophilaceae bacterium]